MAAFIAAGFMQSSASASNEEVASFYKTRNLTIIVGFSAGGGFDLYARLLSRHIGKHLPGNPRAVVQNMPGAGSMTAALNILDIAPKDGSVVGLFGRTVAVTPLMSDRKFDGRRFNWVGSITPVFLFELNLYSQVLIPNPDRYCATAFVFSVPELFDNGFVI